MTIAAAVAGLGRIGMEFELDPRRGDSVSHAGAWRNHPDAELVAGVDPDPDKRAGFEKSFEAPAFSSFQEMIDAVPVDILSISTPPELHAEMTLKAIDAGISRIVCEKPCTRSLMECLELTERLGSQARRVGVNFTRRYDPDHQRVQALLREQQLQSVIGHYTAGLMNTGSHWIDWLLAAGGEVRRVLAFPRVSGDDPTPDALMELSAGGRAYLAALEVSDYSVFEADFFGSQSRVRMLRSGFELEVWERRPSENFSGYHDLWRDEQASTEHALGTMMLSVVNDAILSLREDRPMCCTVQDACRMHSVIDAIKKSLEKGSWMEVTDV